MPKSLIINLHKSNAVCVCWVSQKPAELLDENMQTKKEGERERERLRGSVYVWEDKVSDENRKRERDRLRG